MEKIIKYQSLIIAILNNEKIERLDSSIEDVVVSDQQSRHYQLIRTGWDGDHFMHDIVFHFQIKEDGKIWLLQNNTDIPITDELLKQGVPASDIVLGFHPPKYRRYTDFAEA